MHLCCWTGKCWKRDWELFPVSSHSSVLGRSSYGRFKIREYFERKALLRTSPCRMNEVTGLSPSSLCNPLALPPPWFTFSITPGIPSYHIPDHKTCGTSSSSAPCPLSKYTVSFRNFSSRPSCFQVKTSLHYYYYPQLTSYFPQNDRSIHLSSVTYKFTWL